MKRIKLDGTMYYGKEEKGKTTVVITAKQKPKLEKDIQREMLEWLDKMGFFFWRCNNIPVFSRNNGGKMAFRSLPKYTPRGLPDIILLNKSVFIAIEVKRPGGKLRLEQTEFGTNVTLSGGIYIIADSVDVLASQLMNHNVIK